VDLFNCPEFLELFYAAAKLGLIFVPLNFRLVASEIEYQLNNSGARLLVFDDQLSKVVEATIGRTAVEKDKFVCLKSNLPKSPGCPEWAEDYHGVVDSYPVAEPRPDKPIDIDDDLIILYTSGVTGLPKGAVLTHQQQFYKNYQNTLYTKFRDDDVYLTQLPLYHSGGLCIVAAPALASGITLILRRMFNTDVFIADIERYKVSLIFVLTTMWRRVLGAERIDQTDLSGVRTVVIGGERTEPELIAEVARKFPNAKVMMGFGQTENSAMILLEMTKEELLGKRRGSIGKPGFFSEIWIVDEQGKELPPGQIGEIVARGPVVMRGYWNNPEGTARAIVDGVLHTGDLAYTDEDGYFYMVDRAKDMYRSGGENVYPAEVEKILETHPKIAEVAIIGIPDKKWTETGKAFVVPRKGEGITLDEIHEFLEGKVAHYKFPQALELLDELPMTGSGKIKKVDLKER
jgi:fatty-acyl-CoA synthase